MPLEQCPNCSRRLGPPLKSSGRQVCAKCGWSDKPRQPFSSQPTVTKPVANLSPEDIQKILEQASAQALNNMKPKGKQDPTLPSE